MQNPPLSYREESPSADVSHFVLSFWEFIVDDEISAPLAHEVFPDGCVSIVFYRNEILSVEQLFVSAINRKSIYIPVNAGDRMWGMRILPEACAAFFDANPAQIITGELRRKIPENRFSSGLQSELRGCQYFSEAIAGFENYAKTFGVKPDEIDRRLAKATRIFVATEGAAKIAETAREIGLSERQFERNFRKASGLTPKQFARVCRFRATTLDMLKNSANNWANRAADKGFTDQSHLNREFSQLTGNSPARFSENVKRIKHGKIIE